MISAESDQEKELNTNVNEIDVIIDPLLVQGTKKYVIDFSFKTRFMNLVTFLRDLEFQENVILTNDIDIRLIDEVDNDEIMDPFKTLEANLSMTFYGRI